MNNSQQVAHLRFINQKMAPLLAHGHQYSGSSTFEHSVDQMKWISWKFSENCDKSMNTIVKLKY